MKLNPGMYVRTPLGISKYLGNYDNGNNLHEFDKLDDELWTGDIADVVFDCEIEDVVLKASPCIIDLIEVGDYVNGYKVYNGGKKHFNYIIVWDEKSNYYMKIDLYTIDIKTIVTKEQFENYCYKVVR